MDSYSGYLGLLKWSLAQSDGTAPSESRLSDEDKAWLREAFEALTVDEAKRMKELLATVRDSPDTEDHLDAVTNALEELEYYVESIDSAKDFCTVGGLRVVGSALASRFPELRAGAAHLIATISQNNPAVQPLVLKEHLLTVLLHMTTKDPDAAVQAKALLGVSAIVRDFEDGLSEFLKEDGLTALQSCMNSDDVKLRRRAVFCLRHLTATQPRVVVRLATDSSSLLTTLAALCRGEDDDARENAFHVFQEFLSCPGSGSGGSGAGELCLVPVDGVVPPFYERYGSCCTPTVCLPQAVSERLAAFGALPADEAERLSSEREVLVALQSLLTTGSK